MAKKVFCDACHVEMTGPSSWVSVFIAVNGSARQFIARGHEDRGELDDICEQCICIAFAKKLSYSAVKGVANLAELRANEPKIVKEDVFSMLAAQSSRVFGGSDGERDLLAEKKTVGREASAAIIKAAMNSAAAIHATARADGGCVSNKYWAGIWQAMYDAA